MKYILSPILIAATAIAGFAQADTINSVILNATVIEKSQKVERATATTYSATVKLLTAKVTNRDLLLEMLDLQLIPSIVGYAIVEPYNFDESIGFFAFNARTQHAVQVPSFLLNFGDNHIIISSSNEFESETSSTYTETFSGSFLAHAYGVSVGYHQGFAAVSGSFKYYYRETSSSEIETFTESYDATLYTDFVSEDGTYVDFVQGRFSSRAGRPLLSLPSIFGAN